MYISIHTLILSRWEREREDEEKNRRRRRRGDEEKREAETKKEDERERESIKASRSFFEPPNAPLKSHVSILTHLVFLLSCLSA